MQMRPSATRSAAARLGVSSKGRGLVVSNNTPRANGAARRPIDTKVSDAIIHNSNKNDKNSNNINNNKSIRSTSSSSSSSSSSSTSSSGSDSEENPYPRAMAFSPFRGVSEEEHNSHSNGQASRSRASSDPNASAARRQLDHPPAPPVISPRQRECPPVPFQQLQQQQQQQQPQQEEQKQQPYNSIESRVQSLEQMLLHMSALNRELELELFETRRELALCKQSAMGPAKAPRQLSARPARNPPGPLQRSARHETSSRDVSQSHRPAHTEEVIGTLEVLKQSLQQRGVRSHSQPRPHHMPERVPVSGRMREQNRQRQPSAPWRFGLGPAQRGRSVSAPRPQEAQRSGCGRGRACAQRRSGPTSARRPRSAVNSPAMGSGVMNSPAMGFAVRNSPAVRSAAMRRVSPARDGNDFAELQRRYWEQSREVLEQLDRMLTED